MENYKEVEIKDITMSFNNKTQKTGSYPRNNKNNFLEVKKDINVK